MKTMAFWKKLHVLPIVTGFYLFRNFVYTFRPRVAF